MLRVVLIWGILYAIPLQVSAQNINGRIKKGYEFSYGDYGQHFFLNQTENGDNFGFVTIDFHRGKPMPTMLGAFFRKVLMVKNSPITDTSIIDKAIVKSLMSALQKKGIETLTKCKDDPECKQINFLDADAIGITILSGDSSSYYSYQGIEPYNGKNLEKTTLRKKAQDLISEVDSTLKPKKFFDISFRRLKPGRYFCSGKGYSYLLFRKK